MSQIISQQSLLLANRSDVERLAKYLQIDPRPEWNMRTLVRKVYWNIATIKPKMYG